MCNKYMDAYNNSYAGVHSIVGAAEDVKLTEFNNGSYTYVWGDPYYQVNFREMFNRVADPWEMQSLISNPAWAPKRGNLTARIQRLRTCAGPSCVT